MHDPDEGVGPDGTILTGARRERVPVAFEPIVAAAVDGVRALSSDVALYYSCRSVGEFSADSRAARGFNGDIDVAARQWCHALTRQGVQHMLDGTVTGVVEAFRTKIGLWSDR
jgi:hypothetical protein